MTARPVSDLAADVRKRYTYTLGVYEIFEEELVLLVERLETAEAEVNRLDRMSADYSTQLREAEVQVAALTQERDRLAEALREFGGKPGGLLRIITEKDNAVAALADTRRALDIILEWDCLNPPQSDLLADLPWLKTQLENARALAAKGGGTEQEIPHHEQPPRVYDSDLVDRGGFGGTGQEQQP